MAADPTGTRFTLHAGTVSAQITEVGASLRALRVGSIDLVPDYPDTAPTPAACGVVLAPWPNRVRDGRWDDDGEPRQLAITEPALGNASHGLLRYTAYREVARSDAAVTLAAQVFPQTGYPYHLDTRVTYALTASGVRVTHELADVGEGRAPVALGAHPYLGISDVDTADLSLQLDAATFLPIDAQNIPVGEEPVTPENDLRTPRRVGDLSLNTAYADIARTDGRIAAHVVAPDGRRVTLWAGDGFDYVQLFTTDRFPGRAVAVAVEPMTAPADAFNSGRGLRRLAPGETWTLEWGVELIDAP